MASPTVRGSRFTMVIEAATPFSSTICVSEEVRVKLRLNWKRGWNSAPWLKLRSEPSLPASVRADLRGVSNSCAPNQELLDELSHVVPSYFELEFVGLEGGVTFQRGASIVLNFKSVRLISPISLNRDDKPLSKGHCHTMGLNGSITELVVEPQL